MLRLYTVVFCSGAALMGLEIVGSRVLAPVFGTSIFVWGALITTFLASLSIGYAVGGKLADRRPSALLLGNILVGAGILLWALLYRPAPILDLFARAPVPDRFRSLLAALGLFAVPSVMMGAVTPFATRLAAREIHSIGRTAGNLAAVSTAGSILGTFAMAFVLIPAFPLDPILFGLGATLVVTGGIAAREKLALRLPVTLLLCGAAAGAFLAAPAPVALPVPDGTLVFSKETAYHRLRVVDQGVRRGLWFDNRLQGWVSKGRGPSDDRRNYRDGLLAAMALRPWPPRSVAVLGLGAGMVPAFLTEKAPEVATTSIEIDPEVVAVARRYFGFAEDANDRVVVGDGRAELARLPGKFDVVIMDAYFSDSLPFHLTTREFLELCREKLTDDGVYVANMVGIMTGQDNALFWATYKTLQQVFPRVYVLSTELAAGRRPFISNTMLVGTRSPERLSRGQVLDATAKVSALLGRAPVAEWGQALYDGEVRTADVPVLTDAFSPTDALQHLRGH